MTDIGIVIVGYKNAEGVERLLSSINNVDFDGDKVTLIFSIDFSGDDSVKSLAEKFKWNNGNKIIIAHTENLGLKEHILSCGNYIDKYGFDALIVLEDDLYVSPEMYKYTKGAVEYYKDNPKIAGISLYKHEFNINAKHPFGEYVDCGDTFFIQYAQSWGQVWLKKQWNQFRQWYSEKKYELIADEKLPNNIKKWEKSWLKYHIMYCIDQDLYFVYPRISLSTNFSASGTHTLYTNTSMQVPLCYNKKSDWFFTDFDKSLSVYDAFFENVRIKEKLGLENLEIDLYGIKKYKSSTNYVITRKSLPYKVIKSWGMYLRPLDANIINNIKGDDLFLYDLNKSQSPNTKKSNKEQILEYDLKGINIYNTTNLRLCGRKLIRRIKTKLKIK